MKSEEILYSLDYVGDDLLAEADQRLKVSRPRPWGRVAAAAVLVLVLGVGAWGLSRLPGSRPVPVATEPGLPWTESGSDPVTEPEPSRSEPEPSESEPDPKTPEGLTEADEETAQRIRALLEDEMGLLRWGLTGSYAEPREADLYEIFRNGIPGVDNRLLPEDEAWLRARGVDPVPENATRLEGSAVDAALRQLFGLDRAALAPEGDPGQLFPAGARWNPELDCYYFFVHDNSLGNLKLLHVWVRPGDAIVAEYQLDGAPEFGTWLVTLEPADGGYHIRSNLLEAQAPEETPPDSQVSEDPALASGEAELYCQLPYRPPVDTPEDLSDEAWSALLGAAVQVENAEGELLRLEFGEETVTASGSSDYVPLGAREETVYTALGSSFTETRRYYRAPASESYRFTPSREDRRLQCGVRWEDLFIQVSAGTARSLRIGRDGLELTPPPEASEGFWAELYLNGSRLTLWSEEPGALALQREENHVTLRCTGACQVLLEQYWKRSNPKRLAEESLSPNEALELEIPLH